MEQCCRLCTETTPTLTNISSLRLDSSESEPPVLLADLILQYLSININSTSSEPVICGGCFNQIETWHLFRESCQRHEHKFADQIRQIKFEEVLTIEESHNCQNVGTIPIHTKRSKELETDQLDSGYQEEIGQYYPEPHSPNEESNLSNKVMEATPSSIGSAERNDQTNARRRRTKISRDMSKTPGSKRKRGRPKVTKDDGVQMKNKRLSERRAKQRVLPKICTICGMARTDMAAHLRWHNNERPYKCPYCPKIFVNSSNLKNHINLHTREKMYKCDLCDKEFPSSTGRSKHREAHTTEVAHLCAICGKSFKYRASLARHKQIHFEEPRVKCSACEMVFLTKTRLRKHYLVHLDVKPFSCDICGRAFNRKDNLKTHMKTHATPIQIEEKQDTKGSTTSLLSD